jgi:hypothetical protein
MSTQVEPQATVPDAHVHALAAQIWVAPQAVPQAPQFAGSLVLSTQALLQFVSAPQPVAAGTH